MTWSESGNNERFTVETDIDFDNYNSQPFVLENESNYYFNQYNEGVKSSNASSSFFMAGEGWGITRRNIGYVRNFNSIDFENIYLGANSPNIQYTSVLVGSSNAAIPTG